MNEILRRLLFLPPQASSVAGEIDELHYFVISVTMVGAILVTLVGGYFLVRYRRHRPGPRPPSRGSRGALMFEAAAVMGLAALFLWWWSIGVGQYSRVRVPPTDAMDVYVVAKQWMWKFVYPGGTRTISTLFVPAGRPVRLVMTSRDVIHSFYVPDFRLKQDVLPGRMTTMWFVVKEAGRHEILCAEYCGTSHSRMRGEVIALSPPDYERWLQGEHVAEEGRASGETSSGLEAQGERVAAEAGCLRCHTADGSPHIGPTWAGMVGAEVTLETGEKVVADDAYITESMMDPNAKIHRGFQPVMPSYFGRLRPGDTAAIIEYMKSLRDVPPQPGARDAPVGSVEPGAEKAGGRL